jgi:hypothetical protein
MKKFLLQLVLLPFVIILGIIFLSGCGDISDLSEEDIDCIVNTGRPCDNSPTVTPTVAVATAIPGRTPTKAPTPSKVTPVPTVSLGGNPVCVGVMDSRQHLLWKPVSDNRPSSVIVFDGKYKKPFKKVEVELKTGKFVAANNGNLLLWGNPDSTGPRQHYRFLDPEVKCSEVKSKAIIRADDGYQICQYQLPGDACKRYE